MQNLVSMYEPVPFNINVSDDLLNWINNRIATVRIPPTKDLPEHQKWAYGLPADVAEDLRKYWVTTYNWRNVETKINHRLSMFTLRIYEGDENLEIHFVHHRSSHPGAIPLLFQHGWPGSFLEVLDIIEDLTSPGNPESQAYHVVAPSLPGYGFSSYPSKPFDLAQMASVDNKLMLALGYDRYLVQGGDWGSLVVRLLALNHTDHCMGVHLNMIVAGLPKLGTQPLKLGGVLASYLFGLFTPTEKRKLDRFKWWMDEEYGYSQIQGTKPQTLQYALSDSPFGMCCWIMDKLHKLCDYSTGFDWDVETVITWSMIYTINGSPGYAEIYKYSHLDGQKKLFNQLFDRSIIASIPVGISIFPFDTCYCPRWWAQGTVADNITFWKEHQSGGHFASLETPTALVEDIREWTAISKLGL